MAEKSFGIKELNLIGASGTPSIDSPNNLNLNAVNVAISTNVSIGGTLSVTGNVSIGGTLTYEDVTNIDSVGIVTAREGIKIPDDKKLQIGNNQDIEIYHTSNESFIRNKHEGNYFNFQSGVGASGGFIFKNEDNDETYAILKKLGVELYYNDTKRLETSNTGATVTGTLTATTFSGSGASLTSLPAANLTGTLPAISGANLTNLPTTDPSNSDIQVVYTVTANGTSAYRFAGNGVVSTADNPDLYLIRGQKYRFINNSGGSHPFQIREASGGTAYSTGVTNNGAASGNIDFAPTYDSPAQLVYQCTSHGGMVGNIYLRDAAGGNTNVGVTTFSSNVSINSNLNGSNANFTGELTVAEMVGHTGDTHTKLSFPANDTIAFTTGGTERARITSTGMVGIGTNNVDSPLEVVGTGPSLVTIHHGDGGTNDEARIMLGALPNNPPDNRGAGIAAVNNGAGHDLIIKCSTNHSLGPSEKLRITSDGNVRISDQHLRFDTTGKGIIFGINGGSNRPSIFGNYTSSSDNNMVFNVTGSERLRIASDGSMGLGTIPETDGQASSLYFANGNANIWGSSNVNLYTVVNARYTGAGGFKYNNTAVASYVGQQSGAWNFFNAPSGTADATATFTERFRITSTGEVNIGGNYAQTTAPLCVTTSANAYGIRLQTGSNVVCEILNNDSAGNSEIRGYYNNNSGTRGEGYRLEANGETFFNPGGTTGLSIKTSGAVSIGSAPGSGAGLLSIRPGSSDDTYIKFRRAADFDGTFDGTAIDNRNSANNANRDLIVRFGKMAIWAGGTEKYRIGTAGQFGIGGANYGTAGQVLTSTGSSSGLSWTTPSSGVSMVDEWRLSTNLTNGGSESYITSNWVRNSTNGFSGGVGVIGGAIGSAMSVSSGYFSFPSTGIYKVEFNINYSINDADTKFFEANIIGTKNNSTYTVLARSYGPPIHSDVHNEPMYGSAYTALIFDVTNTNNCKFRLNYSCGTSSNTIIGGGYNATCVTVTRLGDT